MYLHGNFQGYIQFDTFRKNQKCFTPNILEPIFRNLRFRFDTFSVLIKTKKSLVTKYFILFK